jgi:hypothetical protein
MSSAPPRDRDTPSEPPRAPLTERVVTFRAGDGMPLLLTNVRGEREPTRGPVILVHAAGVRSNIFRAPVELSVVDYLVLRGWDVWLLDWRASIDLPFSEWDLDDAAVHDFPAAVRTVLEDTGAASAKAVVHGDGSCGFSMSVAAGLVPGIDTVVGNGASLHPVVPAGSRVKLSLVLPVVGLALDRLDPRWGERAPGLAAKLVTLGGRLTHHSCNNAVCRQVSFTYGSGDPALWRHENISEATHAWLSREFGEVPLTFFRHVARSVRRGSMVSTGRYRELPADFGMTEPQTDARFALLAGASNECFLPESQVATYDFLNRFRKDRHVLHLLPGYSHLDVFVGEQAARDVFPLIHAELLKPAADVAAAARADARGFTLPTAPVAMRATAGADGHRPSA